MHYDNLTNEEDRRVEADWLSVEWPYPISTGERIILSNRNNP